MFSVFQKDHKDSIKKRKAGSFKLNLHPKDFFEENPFRSDKPTPPAKSSGTKKEHLKPFVPSKFPKLVRSHLNYYEHTQAMPYQVDIFAVLTLHAGHFNIQYIAATGPYGFICLLRTING